MSIIISRSSVETTRTVTQPRSDMDANIIDAADTGAAVPSSSTDDDTFRLLDLPPELVVRITSFNNAETMIPVRRACKALQSLTFDQFATEYFEEWECWTATAADFTRLSQILQIPRIAGRIRKLILTTNPLRGRAVTAIDTVPQESETHYNAQHLSMVNIYKNEDCCIDIIKVASILQDLRRLPHGVLFDVVLAGAEVSEWREKYCCFPPHAILLALAMSRTPIDGLKADANTLCTSQSLMSVFSTEIMASMSILKLFNYSGYIYDHDMPLYEQIVRGAPQLRELILGTSLFSYSLTRLRLIALDAELALIRNIPALSTLKVTGAILHDEVLITALRHCQATLTSLTMRHVALSLGDRGWSSILQTILAMSELVDVHLQIIRSDGATQWEDFEIPHENGCQEAHILEGRDNVEKGLQSLLEHYACLEESLGESLEE
jgi:hypothetical protein